MPAAERWARWAACALVALLAGVTWWPVPVLDVGARPTVDAREDGLNATLKLRSVRQLDALGLDAIAPPFELVLNGTLRRGSAAADCTSCPVPPAELPWDGRLVGWQMETVAKVPLLVLRAGGLPPGSATGTLRVESWALIDAQGSVVASWWLLDLRLGDALLRAEAEMQSTHPLVGNGAERLADPLGGGGWSDAGTARSGLPATFSSAGGRDALTLCLPLLPLPCAADAPDLVITLDERRTAENVAWVAAGATPVRLERAVDLGGLVLPDVPLPGHAVSVAPPATLSVPEGWALPSAELNATGWDFGAQGAAPLPATQRVLGLPTPLVSPVGTGILVSWQEGASQHVWIADPDGGQAVARLARDASGW